MNSEPQFDSQTPILTVRGLYKSLSGRRILSDINLDVYPGEIFGFLGPNGSGKTTTIKVILGLLRLDVGEIRIAGYDIKTQFEKAISYAGGIIENPEMYSYLTAKQNLEQYARLYTPRVPEERMEELLSLVGLSARKNDRVGKFSLGMRQRLGLAQALLNRPRLLVLDEPTNGLDPEGIHDLRDILKRLSHEEGTAVFVSSHLLSEMDLMCDRVGIVDHGRLIGVHSMEELRRGMNESDREQFRLETDATAETVQKALESMPDVAAEPAEGGVLLTVPAGTTDAVIRALVLGGVAFRSFTPVRRTLEEAFLDITKQPRYAAGQAGAESPRAALEDEEGKTV